MSHHIVLVLLRILASKKTSFKPWCAVDHSKVFQKLKSLAWQSAGIFANFDFLISGKYKYIYIYGANAKKSNALTSLAAHSKRYAMRIRKKNHLYFIYLLHLMGPNYCSEVLSVWVWNENAHRTGRKNSFLIMFLDRKKYSYTDGHSLRTSFGKKNNRKYAGQSLTVRTSGYHHRIITVRTHYIK